MRFNANTNKAPPSNLRQYLHTLDQEVGSRIHVLHFHFWFVFRMAANKWCLTFTNLLINNLFLKGFLFQFADSPLGLHFFRMQTIFTLHLFLKANLKPHPRLLLIVDFLTDSFNVTYAVQILWPTATSIPHVDSTINCCRRWTLCTVEGEIPSTAAAVTVIDSKSASPGDTQRCVVWQLLENTFLWKYK